jgi:transcriptional regulator with XRE-family HTH domain
MELKHRLAELRRERKMTLRELRERIRQRTGEKLSISYLSELERTNTVPSVETLGRVAAGYDLSLYDLLAPVDSPVNFSGGGTDAQYPQALRTLVEEGRIDEEWAKSLSRIEFRGRRPSTEAEWMAIYSTLNAFIGQE